jgi:hypothetical protein
LERRLRLSLRLPLKGMVEELEQHNQGMPPNLI